MQFHLLTPKLFFIMFFRLFTGICGFMKNF